MNAIVKFRKCTLSDDELLRQVDQLTDLMYQTGRIPDRQIPARPDEDYDLLVGELVTRYHILMIKIQGVNGLEDNITKLEEVIDKLIRK